jgi:hypothetical protein
MYALKSAQFIRHTEPPEDVEILPKKEGWLLGRGPRPNIGKSYHKERVRYDINTGKPYLFVEKWIPCHCSDGPCEMGLMNKFEIGINGGSNGAE